VRIGRRKPPIRETKLVSEAHVPMRTCLVCGKKDAKSQLLRVALSPEDGTIVLDSQQRMEGRGAYVCQGCRPRLCYTKRVQKAFRNEAKGLGENIGR
jgi:predicted RNA-binding protein YlxR (DUF448 family)